MSAKEGGCPTGTFGPVIASAVGSQASLVAEKIEVDVPPDPTTYDI